VTPTSIETFLNLRVSLCTCSAPPRFTLGLGASNPQVVEGFRGVRYDAPVARTREIVEICRAVWRRERVEHDGGQYRIPLPPEQGTGLGKPLRLINHPVRERIPIVLVALGPRNVALAAEIAEGCGRTSTVRR
jgi:alkanesulfonate monooxygenase SsuD/methylene tetrahydromethanopterin reductase-like flavin-dependent oxidoreductase (luciferase family)